MLRLFFRFFLWLADWKIMGKRPDSIKKYIVILAPHTSNWDFPIGISCRPFLNIGDSKYLIKKEWIESPIGGMMKALGAIPVDRSRHTNLVDQVVEAFNAREELGIAITPEGTRSKTDGWKTGFYHIALKANVPIICGFMDYYRREVGLGDLFYATGNMEADMAKLQAFYADKLPRHPAQSSIPHIMPAKKPSFMWKMRPLWKSLLLLLLLFGAYNYELIGYGLKQAYGQLRILWKAEPIESFLNDPNFPHEDKEKIRLIQEIRAFAFDSLGLDRNGSYTTLYDQAGEPLLWNVTACKPYQLEAYTWRFPLLGSFSYKGFFSEEAALRTARELEEEGYDTDVYEVGGWSTLGILNDPILSGMLKRQEGSLANLIIHELTHGTLYVKDGVSYNENLASFVGDWGALRFLAHKYGENSPQYVQYVQSKEDRETFSSYALQQANALDSLYQSFTPADTEVRKRDRKQAFIEQFVKGLQELTFHNGRYYKYFGDELPNNTFFMGNRRYRGQQNQFKQEFEQQFNSDFKAYLKYLKEKYKPLI